MNVTLDLSEQNAAALEAQARAAHMPTQVYLNRIIERALHTDEPEAKRPRKSTYRIAREVRTRPDRRRDSGKSPGAVWPVCRARMLMAGVAVTHAALWYLLQNPRLSPTARRFMDGVARAGDSVALSSISLAEIVYLVEKKRLQVSAYQDLKAALADPEYVIDEAPFHQGIVEAMLQVPRSEVPDMPDRIVAPTGVYFGVPVISGDGRIRSSLVQTIW